MRYQNENEIAAFAGRFERGEVPESEWRHRDHLTVALYYIERFGAAKALELMRAGIHNLLRAYGVDPTGTSSPYHETLTVFWVGELERFRAGNPHVPLAELEERASEMFDKDYPLKFYRRELLYGSLARREWVEPQNGGSPAN